MSLDEIYLCHEGKVSDKWTPYISEYERLFSEYRTLPVRILEIGIQNCGSLAIWSEYFHSLKKAVGCEINPDRGKLSYDHPAITILTGDANHEATEQKILEESNSFDIIIDASHKARGIVAFFIRYFPHLENDGIFVAEGLCCSSWEDAAGGSLGTDPSIEFFKLLRDVINHGHWRLASKHVDLLHSVENEYGYKITEDLLDSIHSIEFSNSLCVIRKSSPNQFRLGNQKIGETEDLVDSKSDILQRTKYSNPDHMEERGVSIAPVVKSQEMLNFTQAQLKRNKLALELSSQLDKLKKKFIQLEEENANLKKHQNQLYEQILVLNQSVVKATTCLNIIYNSRSWRLTKLLRIFYSFTVSQSRKIRHYISFTVSQSREIRHYVSFTISQSRKIKPDFSNVKQLRHKLNLRLAFTRQSKNTPPVSLLDAAEFEAPSARLLAFYFPQNQLLEPISKQYGNDQNLETQFTGRKVLDSQSRLKKFNVVECGQVQSSQIELAKRYGISGLCFVFHWFNGKQSLDSHISDYRNNASEGLPFCLCWENENQRLDENDIAPQRDPRHSPQDDLDFIVAVSSYLRDPQYIRINNQPLLLISQPAHLPLGKETTERWRNWCRENGIGEIFLACPDSSEIVSPVEHGFNNSIKTSPSKLSDVMSHPEYSRNTIRRARHFFKNIIKRDIFSKFTRGNIKKKSTMSCCFNSDSTKKEKNNSTVSASANHSPLGYQQWLFDATKCVINNIDEPEERIILINGWNRWIENSHLDPGKKYGYAYLEATRMALLRNTVQQKKQTRAENETLAIVIHAFYLDIFEEILEYIRKIDLDLKLFVTTPEQQEQQAREMLNHSGFEFELLPVGNRGRDVWPFLQIMPKVVSGGHEFVLKLHTKKSKHLRSGSHWRMDIYQKLMAEKKVRQALNLFKYDSEIGIIGPENHIYSMSSNFLPNKFNILRLAERMGINQEQVSSLSFVAGTMFYARVSVLQPILNLAIKEEDFDREAGQTDGTFAHAIERAFSVGTLAVGKRLVDSSYVEGNQNTKVVEQFRYI